MNQEKNKLKRSNQSDITLWRWVCSKLILLVIASTLAITTVMWLRYYIPEKMLASRIPVAEQKELSLLLRHPETNLQRYHQLLDKWYGVSYSDPTLDPTDWLLILLLIIITIPIIVTVTLRSVRPLTLHITALANFARNVSEGSFGIDVKPPDDVPSELKRLTEALNLMSHQLGRYDRELKASHAALAHELRSPLTASMGRLQGMIDGVFPASEEQLMMVMKQMKHLNHLVEDLHLLSLADAGHLYLNYQSIALDEVINEKISWLRPRLMEMDFQIHSHSDGKVCFSADHFRIGQIFSILLDNAMRYASEGKRVDILYRKLSGIVTVEVKDYGKGVSDEFIQNIFIRFSRADTSRARNSGGSGLGLSIAKAICVAHGGDMQAYRNDAGGLTIAFELPAHDPVKCYPQ